jgi:hypothetical protein
MRATASSSPSIGKWVALGLAACLVSPVVTATSHPETWSEARSPHFRVIGTAKSNPALMAQRLELFRDVVEQRGHSLELGSDRLVTVVLLPGEELLAAEAGDLIRGETKYAGLSVPLAGQPYVLVNAKDPKDDALTTAYRGYMDVTLALDESPLPLWFREGLASYYQSFGTIRSSALIGRAVPDYLVYLRTHPMMPLDRLLGMNRAEVDRLDPGERLLYTAESWVLIHSQFAAGYDGKRQLGRVLELLERGTAPDTAIRQAFETDSVALQRKLEDYIRLRRLTFTQVRFEQSAHGRDITSHPIPREVVLTELERLRHGETEVAGLVRAPGIPLPYTYPLQARVH